MRPAGSIVIPPMSDSLLYVRAVSTATRRAYCRFSAPINPAVEHGGDSASRGAAGAGARRVALGRTLSYNILMPRRIKSPEELRWLIEHTHGFHGGQIS